MNRAVPLLVILAACASATMPRCVVKVSCECPCLTLNNLRTGPYWLMPGTPLIPGTSARAAYQISGQTNYRLEVAGFGTASGNVSWGSSTTCYCTTPACTITVCTLGCTGFEWGGPDCPPTTTTFSPTLFSHPPSSTTTFSPTTPPSSPPTTTTFSPTPFSHPPSSTPTFSPTSFSHPPTSTPTFSPTTGPPSSSSSSTIASGSSGGIDVMWIVVILVAVVALLAVLVWKVTTTTALPASPPPDDDAWDTDSGVKIVESDEAAAEAHRMRLGQTTLSDQSITEEPLYDMPNELFVRENTESHEYLNPSAVALTPLPVVPPRRRCSSPEEVIYAFATAAEGVPEPPPIFEIPDRFAETDEVTEIDEVPEVAEVSPDEYMTL